MVEILNIFSWPLVVLIVAVVAILIFRKAITDVLIRLRRVGVAGVTLDTDAALAAVSNQSQSRPLETGLPVRPDPNAETENRLRQVRNVGVPPIVQEQQKAIQADLQKLGVSQQEQVELLVKHLAVTQLLLAWESVYRDIFGSQIALLKFLNTSPKGAARAQISEFYNNAKAQFPKLYTNYQFEQYLQYLLTQRLVTTQAQDHDRYFITVGGQEFLKWMPAARVTENKPF